MSNVVEILVKSKDQTRDGFASADRSASSLGSKLAKVGKIAAIGLAAGVAVAGKALWDMGKAAAVDEAAQAKLAKTLQNAAGATDAEIASVEDWISAQGRALGVTDDELRPALERLVTATGDVGEAQKLASLAMDVSAGSGKSLESVSTALMKAQNGQVSALARLGINTKNAKGETITFEQAVKRMGDTFGGQAATKANTLEGKMNRLKLIFDETKETIGAKLLPVATRLAEWFLNEGLPAITKFGNWLGSKLGPIFLKVGQIWKQITGSMSGDTNKTVSQIRSILSSLGSIFSSVVSIIQSLWQRFGSMLTSFAKGSFKNLIQIISGAFQIIRGIFKVISSLLKGDWRGVWEGIKDILKGAWKVINGLVRQALNVLKLILRAAWSVIKSLTKAAWDGIKQLPRLALNAIKAYIRTAITGYRALFRAGWEAIKNLARAAWDGIKQIVRNGADNLVEQVRSIPGRLRSLAGKFGEAGRAIIGAFINGLKQAGGVVSDIAGNVWTALKGTLNNAIDRINSALEFKISVLGKGVTINPPDIQHLATGGVVKARPGGTLALIGEGGHDEAVVPLSGPHAPKIRGGGRGSAQPVIVQLVVSGKVLEQVLIKHSRDVNRPLQVRTLGAT